jgi:hypothetical protein
MSTSSSSRCPSPANQIWHLYTVAIKVEQIRHELQISCYLQTTRDPLTWMKEGCSPRQRGSSRIHHSQRCFASVNYLSILPRSRPPTSRDPFDLLDQPIVLSLTAIVGRDKPSSAKSTQVFIKSWRLAIFLLLVIPGSHPGSRDRCRGASHSRSLWRGCSSLVY